MMGVLFELNWFSSRGYGSRWGKMEIDAVECR